VQRILAAPIRYDHVDHRLEARWRCAVDAALISFNSHDYVQAKADLPRCRGTIKQKLAKAGPAQFAAGRRRGNKSTSACSPERERWSRRCPPTSKQLGRCRPRARPADLELGRPT
jgi:hypothetical protein